MARSYFMSFFVFKKTGFIFLFFFSLSTSSVLKLKVVCLLLYMKKSSVILCKTVTKKLLKRKASMKLFGQRNL